MKHIHNGDIGKSNDCNESQQQSQSTRIRWTTSAAIFCIVTVVAG